MQMVKRTGRAFARSHVSGCGFRVSRGFLSCVSMRIRACEAYERISPPQFGVQGGTQSPCPIINATGKDYGKGGILPSRLFYADAFLRPSSSKIMLPHKSHDTAIEI